MSIYHIPTSIVLSIHWVDDVLPNYTALTETTLSQEDMHRMAEHYNKMYPVE